MSRILGLDYGMKRIGLAISDADEVIALPLKVLHVNGPKHALEEVVRACAEAKADKLLHKVSGYRIFSDAEGKMNLNVGQIGGSLLVVSQFTLAADTGKGMRPSFSGGAHPADAERLYEYFVARARESGVPTETGRFAADMKVRLLNDGPVTFWLQV